MGNKDILDQTDRNIINTLQYGFPLSDHPYKEAADSLNITEDELLHRLKSLLDSGLLTRFGPLFNAENMGGALSLCAMIIPEAEFETVTEQVNALPEVAHNYQRDHEMNMWFVLATESLKEKHKTLKVIEQQTGYKVYDMPKEKEYFVGLFLKI
ncbi:MAG: Lrp/AsnC family transcriptional regulator [Cocleimonas sp.]|nr:Lrp/AsnC family transcriptional regulator [Cocleimonas sp.]